MHKENNNNIIYSTILLPELPSSILESIPERNQHNQRFFTFSRQRAHTFLCVDCGNILAVYGGSEIIKHILICVPKMNEGLTGLERHEGE